MTNYYRLLAIVVIFIPNLLFANHLIIGIGSTPNNLDPYFATDANSQDINRLLHTSLVDAGPDMKTTCRACTKFEERFLSDGSHVIRFWLKKDLKFQDGSKLKASDVVLSVNKILAVFDAPIPNLFKELTQAQAVDEYTVDLSFKSYRPENLTNLSLLKIENFVGGKRIPGGNYKLIESSESKIVVKGPHLYEFKVVTDETTMALKLINGEIDLIATSMSPRKIEWLESQKGIKAFSRAGTNYVYISPQHRHPDLKDQKVRRALSHLIPRDQLAEYKQKNTVELAEGMFSSAFAELYLGRKPISFEPDKAKELLTQAGYKFAEGKWTKDNRVLAFTLKISNKKHIIELANALVPFFKEAGIELKVQAAEWGTFYRDLKTGNFDLALGQWVGFVGPDQMGFTFQKESFPPKGANRGFYFDKEFENWYSKALIEKDHKKQYEYYRKAYARLIDDEAYISLWHPKIIWPARDCVKEIELYPTGSFLAFETMEHTCRP